MRERPAADVPIRVLSKYTELSGPMDLIRDATEAELLGALARMKANQNTNRGIVQEAIDDLRANDVRTPMTVIALQYLELGAYYETYASYAAVHGVVLHRRHDVGPK